MSESTEIPDILLGWDVPEYVQHERSTRWYVITGILGVLLLVWALMSANFLFAIILVMSGILMFLNAEREPRRVPVFVSHEGVTVGERTYPFYEFKNFSILYRPPQVKNLYLVSEKQLRPVLSLSLEDMDPNVVREVFLEFLPEDLDRVEETLTELVTRVYKL